MPTLKELDVTSHPVRTCNGTLILDIYSEQRLCAQKLLFLHLIASSSLIIDIAYIHTTTTPVSSKLISSGGV